jgi:hypothetical protein
MIGKKELHYTGKGTDLGTLQSHIEEYLKADGFKVQTSAPSDKGSVLQARKGGFLRGVVDADSDRVVGRVARDRDGQRPVGVGKWLEHLGVAALETLLLSELFLVVDVAESAWNIEIEDKLVKDIEKFVG